MGLRRQEVDVSMSVSSSVCLNLTYVLEAPKTCFHLQKHHQSRLKKEETTKSTSLSTRSLPRRSLDLDSIPMQLLLNLYNTIHELINDLSTILVELLFDISDRLGSLFLHLSLC